ncbi:uncharacterized protein LOC105179067 isoform X3 [Sesamum indicum]|uniref:Uncharacterized protein LOC105179067 isoform X2 n=1 Tax=Sesamum indicum TaxID=4182 RepID=A0A8M8USP6_SESIN|nr:uncharacterized protein LOC105179067 isoform X2 [Sesamum indicum]XP_020546881.1 uncharacterized protein LOC105179067 isoform X3 [Sesamum indicum]
MQAIAEYTIQPETTPADAEYTIQPETTPADADARMPEQGRLKLRVMNLNSKSQLLGIDQLAHLLSSSCHCSHPQKDVNKSHLSLTRIWN